jgi:hypothetical protein
VIGIDSTFGGVGADPIRNRWPHSPAAGRLAGRDPRSAGSKTIEAFEEAAQPAARKITAAIEREKPAKHGRKKTALKLQRKLA